MTIRRILPPLIPGEDIILRRGEIISVVRTRDGDMYYTSNLYTKFIESEEFIGVFNKPYPANNRRILWMKKDVVSIV